MRQRVEGIVAHYRELEARLADPAVLADAARMRAITREMAGWEDLVRLYGQWQTVAGEIETARDLARDPQADPETRAWAEAEWERAKGEAAALERRLQALLLPRDPNDARNVIVEIRAGAGGEEAALFAADLYRMYTRYAERKGWKSEILSQNPTDIGGFKEVVFAIEGRGAFSRLKFERGVHRVQRVPVTEAGGRIHTSTVTVAVLPEAEEVDVEIDPDDLRIETMRSGGAGGQHVNKTESAVRITHLPTGIVVLCQDERSQHKNRDRAMKVLRARLLDLAESNRAQELAEARRAQVGTGDRSERIRTYNFPQGRITDHRIGLTSHRLEEVLDGDLDPIIDALVAADEEARLKQAADLRGAATS
ncbi:MAG: peptide chain release factor 1 [Firmicutes bacterium]|nr:peptide chain release factor 1 [Bacillota bacterium]